MPKTSATGPGGGTTKVFGLDELKRGMRDLADEIDHGADDALDSVAEQTANMVRAKVPRLTGRLAASVTTSGGMFSEGATVGLGGLGVPYAGWIEFGGSRGRPMVREGRYLFPTAEDNKGVAERAAEASAKAQIRRQIWPRPNRW